MLREKEAWEEEPSTIAVKVVSLNRESSEIQVKKSSTRKSGISAANERGRQGAASEGQNAAVEAGNCVISVMSEAELEPITLVTLSLCSFNTN